MDSKWWNLMIVSGKNCTIILQKYCKVLDYVKMTRRNEVYKTVFSSICFLFFHSVKFLINIKQISIFSSSVHTRGLLEY